VLHTSSDNVECVEDLFFLDGPTNVQKVGWFTSVQFDYVHRGHGKTGTID
jgi:hypothetical protein